MRICYNGATSARSWKSRAAGGHAVNLQASMGPRARARGNGLGERAEFAGSGASMGPRARARGNQTGLRRTTWVYLLQWGHERALVAPLKHILIYATSV